MREPNVPEHQFRQSVRTQVVRVAAAVALLCSFVPAEAADGVFCKGRLLFAERGESNGDMRFGVAGTNSMDHIFSEQGVAKPHKDGWRYQVLSRDAPEERCTIDIEPIGGGFRLRTHEGASCDSSGGYRASEVIADVTFPASSRVRDVTHDLDPGKQILDAECSPQPPAKKEDAPTGRRWRPYGPAATR